MASLLTDNLFSSPERYDWRRLSGLDDIIFVPQPTLEDLENFSFSPDELRERGHDVPEAHEEALAYAIGKFKESDGYEDWRQGFMPLMAVLWPCTMRCSPQEAAEAFKANGLACTSVHGDIHGREVTGIALSGGGMDLSDHIAAAYVLCGQTPPVPVLESALRVRSPKMEEDILRAADIAAEVCQNMAARIRDLAEDRTPGYPRP